MAKQKLKLQQQQQPGHGPAVDAGVKGASQQQQQQQQRQAGGPPVALEVIYPVSWRHAAGVRSAVLHMSCCPAVVMALPD
jgi:hypothetical protein